jgi:hypothetical protein
MELNQFPFLNRYVNVNLPGKRYLVMLRKRKINVKYSGQSEPILQLKEKLVKVTGRPDLPSGKAGGAILLMNKLFSIISSSRWD